MYIAESVFKTELKFNQPEVVPVVNLQNSDFIVVLLQICTKKINSTGVEFNKTQQSVPS